MTRILDYQQDSKMVKDMMGNNQRIGQSNNLFKFASLKAYFGII